MGFKCCGFKLGLNRLCNSTLEALAVIYCGVYEINIYSNVVQFKVQFNYVKHVICCELMINVTTFE